MEWIFANAQSTQRVAVHRQSDHFTVRIGQENHRAKVLHYQAPRLTLLVDDHHVIESDVEWSHGQCVINLGNVPHHFAVTSAANHASAAPDMSSTSQDIRAPLPGRIVELLVQVGDAVHLGQPVCIIEAMKMQNEICAGRDGVVETITVMRGASVENAAALMTITHTKS